MKILTLICIQIILSSSLLASDNSYLFDKHWSLKRDTLASKNWVSKTRPNILASSSLNKKIIDTKAYKNKKNFDLLLKHKKLALDKIKIKKWKIKESKWIKKKNSEYLIMNGTYIDHQEKFVTFYEVYKFSKNGMTTLLYTQLDQEIIDVDHLKSFLNYFGAYNE